MIRRLAGAVRSSSGSNSRSGRRPKDRNAGGTVRLLRRDAAGQPATGKLRCEEGNRGVYGLARTGHSPTNSCQELAKPGVYLRPIRRVDHRVRSSTDRARGMPINQLQVKQAWPRRSRNGFQVLALDGLASAGTVHDAEFLRHYRETGDRRRLRRWSTGTPNGDGNHLIHDRRHAGTGRSIWITNAFDIVPSRAGAKQDTSGPPRHRGGHRQGKIRFSAGVSRRFPDRAAPGSGGPLICSAAGKSE